MNENRETSSTPPILPFLQQRIPQPSLQQCASRSDILEQNILKQNPSETSEENSVSQEIQEFPDLTSLRVDKTHLLSENIDVSNSSYQNLEPENEKLSVIEKKKRNFQHCKQDLIQNLQDERNEIQEKIDVKEREYEIHQKKLSKFIDMHAQEMSSIIGAITKVEDENAKNNKEIETLHKEIVRMRELQKKLSLKCKENNSKIEYLEGQKKLLEDRGKLEMTLAKTEGEILSKTLQQLNDNLKENLKTTEDLEKNDKTELNKSVEVPNTATTGLIDFLSSSIKEKEADLECPVCMETAEIPIYTCNQMHLICSKCRPKLDVCPVCRTEYQDMRRHRYAEKTAQEIKKLKEMLPEDSKKNRKKKAASKASEVDLNDDMKKCKISSKQNSIELPSSSPERPLSGVPRQCQQIRRLEHGGCVQAVVMAYPLAQVYTGGGGTVKVWDISQVEATTNQPVSSFACPAAADADSLVMKLLPDGKTLITGGYTPHNYLSVWDLNGPQSTLKADLVSEYQAVRDLVVSPDSKLLYSCSKHGSISVWDLHNNSLVKEIPGTFGTACMAISPTGNHLFIGDWSDNNVRCLDIRTGELYQETIFSSEVSCLDFSAIREGQLLGAGLENSFVNIINLNQSMNFKQYYPSVKHERGVLSLKFAKLGNWFVSTSKSREVFITANPENPVQIFKSKETSKVPDCDISKDDNFIVTAGGDKGVATIYEMIY